jgi:DNA (cytosine-5)-methyltransferase 1
MLPIIVERKAGLNRGKRRVWIEGKDLVAAGFTSGNRFDIEFSYNLITLTLNPEGMRKVSGKTKPDGTPHPIIDLIGEKVAEAIADRERVQVTYQTGKITIKPIF